MDDIALNIALIQVGRMHHRRSHSEFAKIGVSKGQPRILDYLAVNDGCSQRDLAEKCNIEPATVTSILGGLEKQGLISRIQSKNDKRVQQVYLTEEGKLAQQKVSQVHRTLAQECYQGFSKEEKELVFSFLQRMKENLLEGERNE